MARMRRMNGTEIIKVIGFLLSVEFGIYRLSHNGLFLELCKD